MSGTENPNRYELNVQLAQMLKQLLAGRGW